MFFNHKENEYIYQTWRFHTTLYNYNYMRMKSMDFFLFFKHIKKEKGWSRWTSL